MNVEWVYLSLITCISVWLAYMNWKARVDEGQEKKAVEVNPIWGAFDKHGFRRIQFAIVPIFYVLLGTYFCFQGNSFGIGVLFGFIFLNTIMDATTLNSMNIMKGTALESGRADREGKAMVMRNGFMTAFLQWSVIFVTFFTLILSFGLSLFVFVGLLTKTLEFSLVILATAIGLFAYGCFFLHVARKMDMIDILLFRVTFQIFKDEGLPRKTELTET